MKKQNKNENKKKLNPIAVIITIIVIAVIVAGIWLIINKNKKSNSNNPALEGEAIEQVGLIDMSNEENAKIENGVKENTSRDLLKDRDIDGITIKNIKLNAEGGISNFTATVQNDSPVDFAGGVAKIKFINQDGSDYAELEVYIPELKVGTTNTIDVGTTADIANAFDFSIELEK